MIVHLPITVETVSETIGFWCGDCLDSSGVKVTYSITFKDDLAIGSATGCPECGAML